MKLLLLRIYWNLIASKQTKARAAKKAIADGNYAKMMFIYGFGSISECSSDGNVYTHKIKP